MKALSIRQPWAWLIVHGIKDIENRQWATAYRGPLAIHASLRPDEEAYERLRERYDLPPLAQMPRGALVGCVTVTGCVTHSESPWFTGAFGFVLDAAQQVRPLPLKGKLGLFTLPASITEWLTFDAHSSQRSVAPHR